MLQSGDLPLPEHRVDRLVTVKHLKVVHPWTILRCHLALWELLFLLLHDRLVRPSTICGHLYIDDLLGHLTLCVTRSQLLVHLFDLLPLLVGDHGNLDCDEIGGAALRELLVIDDATDRSELHSGLLGRPKLRAVLTGRFLRETGLA